MHNCKEFKAFKKLDERFDYCFASDWEIDESGIVSVNEEYSFPATYCPFCAVQFNKPKNDQPSRVQKNI